jgi:hypothetical protein
MMKKSQMSFGDMLRRFDIAKDYVIKRLSDVYESLDFNESDDMISPIPDENIKTPVVENLNDKVVVKNIPSKKSYEEKISYPKQVISSIIDYVFKDEADNMRLVLKGENASWNPKAININKDGSVDRGLFQINSNTFYDFKRRYPEKFKKYNINTFDDMDNPLKNALVAKMILDEQGYKAWYGAPSYLRNKK